LQIIIETSNMSTKKVIVENEVDQSVYNILEKHKFHPSKMYYVQELVHEDFDQRMEFYKFKFCKIKKNAEMTFQIL